MSRLPSKSIPTDYQRIVLINPTKFIGNLLLAGGLIKEFERYCRSLEKSLLIVVDERFKTILQGVFSESSLLFYPSTKINAASSLGKIHAYLSCVKQIRRFKADIAFNIEEDSISHRLTQLSGAKFKLGCSKKRHKVYYDHVLPIEFALRPKHKKHRWHSYYEVFAAFGMPEPPIQYMKLAPKLLTQEKQEQLTIIGINFNSPIVILHPGATKDYKKWPLLNFVILAESLIKSGFQPIFIGNGEHDRSTNRAIMMALDKIVSPGKAINLVDCFSLAELTSFMTLSAAIVGNDSGPFHLASALGIPGCVIFGPTDVDIWRPLYQGSEVLSGKDECDAQCTRNNCQLDYRCLSSINPLKVSKKITLIINT